MKSSLSKFLAIDFETANHQRDSACAVGLVRVEDNKVTQRFYSLIRPPSRHFIFTKVHGITWEKARLAPSFKALWPEIKPFFDDLDFLVAHNARFDQSVLKACLEREGLPFLSLAFQCTVKIARNTWALYPTRLPDVCDYLKIQLSHHDALSDALACAQILIASEAIKNKMMKK